MSTESTKSAEAATAGSVKHARLHTDADTKALVTKLIGEHRMDDFLASDEDYRVYKPKDFDDEKSDDGGSNSDDSDDENPDDRLTKRFKNIFADMLIAAAPQAAQRKLSVTSPVQLAVEISPAAAAAATIIDKMCPYDLHREQIAENHVPRKDGGMEYYLWTLWLAFLEAVSVVPYDNPLQDELVGFLTSLGSKSRGTAKIWGFDNDLWSYLPLFGAVVREAYIHLETYDQDILDRKQQDFEYFVQRWVNHNTFLAREVATIDNMPLLFGVTEVAMALEEPHPSRAGLEDRIIAFRKENFAGNLRVACNWILIAGRTMYRLVIRDIDDNLDKGTSYYCSEVELRIIRKTKYELYPESGGSTDDKHIKRWLFWQKRFEVLGSNDENDPDSGIRLGLEDTLRADARLAAQRMDEYIAQVDAELAEKIEEGDEVKEDE